MRPLIATITFLLCAEAAWASASSFESKFGNLELRSCLSNGAKCIVLKSPSTLGSKFKNLQKLSKPSVELIDTTAGTTENITAQTGYLDLAENKLSLYERHGVTLQETSISLDTLVIQKMEHK